MMQEDRQHASQVVTMVTDPERQKELLQQDEEEDFLDEGHIKHNMYLLTYMYIILYPYLFLKYAMKYKKNIQLTIFILDFY